MAQLWQLVEGWVFNLTLVYWFLAVFGTVFLFLQILLSLIFGFGGGHDFEFADADGDGVLDGHGGDAGMGAFKFLSLRAVLAFLTFFGWGGVFFGGEGLAGLMISLGIGLAAMFSTAAFFGFMLRLAHTGTVTSADIVGKSGVVYLKVPGGRTGSGRVTVSLSGCTREISAVSDEDLPTGTSVKVLGILDGQRYLVEKQ